MATFSNLKAKGIGTSEVIISDIVIPTVITGCSMANIIGSSASISLYIVNVDEEENETIYYIVKDHGVDGGQNYDAISSNKIFLKNGDSLRASASVAASFDVLVSIMDGI